MPGITAAPSPVVSSPKSSNSPSSTDAANTAEAGAANPFSSVLQRFVKSKDGQAKESSVTTGKQTEQQQNRAETGIGETDPALMASLMAMLQGQQNSTDKDTAALVDDKKNQETSQTEEGVLGRTTDNPLASLALTQPSVTTDTKANSSDTQAGNDGKPGLSLAAKAANLATEEIVDGKAGGKTERGGEESFQALLDNSRTAQLQNQTHTTPIATQVARQENRIETPVGHQNWSQEVGDKLAWMVGKQESKADLVLNPPQMGRIEVSITMNGDQANASFNSSNPAVREALESALPRLKEILADAGVRLDQTHVGTDTRGDTPQNQERRDNSGHNNKVVAGEFVPGLTPITSGSSQWLRQGNGMVDTFA